MSIHCDWEGGSGALGTSAPLALALPRQEGGMAKLTSAPQQNDRRILRVLPHLSSYSVAKNLNLNPNLK